MNSTMEVDSVRVQALEHATWTAKVLGRPVRAAPQQLTPIDIGEDFIARRMVIAEQLESVKNGLTISDLDELLQLTAKAGRRIYW